MLTSEQREAVETSSNRVLVRAGAGSGKTEVITHRIIHLLEHHETVSTRDIAIITFTNKATENVKDRLKKHLYRKWLQTNDGQLKKKYRTELETLNIVQLSTIHQFCRMILNLAGPSQIDDVIHYAPTYRVNDQIINKAADHVVQAWIIQGGSNQEKLLRLWPAHLIRKYLLQGYQLIRNKGLLFEQVLKETERSVLLKENGDVARVKESYIHMLKALKEEETKLRLRTLSTDGLLEYSAKLLSRDEELVQRVRQKFKYIFVDEFQDTSAYQTEILRLLCEGGEHPTSLFVVGDLKQSIYQFRGADTDSYKSVEQWIQETGQVLKLSKNFRSVKSIVDYVNTTFRIISDDEKKPLFEAEDLHHHKLGELTAEETVHFVPMNGLTSEERVVQLIQEEVNKGATYGQFAVIFRTNRNMGSYYQQMRQFKIPAQLIGAGNLFVCQEIRDMFRIINYLVTPGDLIKREEALQSSIVRGNELILKELMDQVIPLVSVYTAAQIIEEIIKRSDIRAIYKEELNEQAVANLDRLKEITRELSSNENIQLVNYIKWFSIQLSMNKDERQAEVIDRQNDAVQLITTHRAKGLEFPYVILVELDRNLDSPALIPNFLYEKGLEFEFKVSSPFGKTSISSSNYNLAKEKYVQQYLAEEARVLYVAMTRAEEKLFFVVNESLSVKLSCYQNWIWQPERTEVLARKEIAILKEEHVNEPTDSPADMKYDSSPELSNEERLMPPILTSDTMWQHQIEAIQAFLQSKHGILEMATGTGKTKTAIYIINELLESNSIDAVVVTVDGTDLLDQWCKQLLSDTPIPLYRQYEKYKQIGAFSINENRRALVVSRNQLDLLFEHMEPAFFERALIVCDEVHGMGAETKIKKLEGKVSLFNYRLGLSATPEREYDAEGNDFISREIGPIIYTFTLEDAIQRGILCEFNYIPLEFELTDEDRNARKKAIASHFAAIRDGKPVNPNELYTKLARVKKQSEGKLPVFKSFIANNTHLLERSVIFVETIEFGQKVQEIILPLIANYHTYFGDDERKNLDRFSKGEIDCLIAAKRISEGIDIRSVNNIILLTVDRAKLQTIQRIGRSLRTNPSEPDKRASIVDFIEVNPEKDVSELDSISTDQERKDWLSRIAEIKRKG